MRKIYILFDLNNIFLGGNYNNNLNLCCLFITEDFVDERLLCSLLLCKN